MDLHRLSHCRGRPGDRGAHCISPPAVGVVLPTRTRDSLDCTNCSSFKLCCATPPTLPTPTNKQVGMTTLFVQFHPGFCS